MADKRRRYTDEERADLMVMLESQGYPGKLGALKKVAEYASIQPNVLRRWWQAKQNPPPHKLVARKKIDLREAIESELSDIFAEMKTKREDASYRDLGTVAGILFDKKQLIDDKPTEHTKYSGEIQQTSVNISAENAHDASNILKQLADLGAIPPTAGEAGHDTEAE